MNTSGLVLVVAAFFASAPPATAPSPAPQLAPDFTFTDLKGAAHTLAELRGHVVLLEFWAPWCIPCRKGFPLLDQLQTKQDAAGLKVVAVTMETDEDSVREFTLTYPVRFLVGRDITGHAGEAYDVTVMPTSVLVDRDGRLIARFEGGSDSVHRQMEAAVQTAMAGTTLPSAPATKRRQGSKGGLRAWERGYLADRIMNLDGDPLTRSMREHIHSSKEAAAGDGGVAGGGCGCN